MKLSLREVSSYILSQLKREVSEQEFVIRQSKVVTFGNTVSGTTDLRPTFSIFKRYTGEEYSSKPLVVIDIWTEKVPPENLAKCWQVYAHNSKIEYVCIDMARRIVYHWLDSRWIQGCDIYKTICLKKLGISLTVAKVDN